MEPETPFPGAPDRMGYWRTLAQSRELLTGVAIVLVLATLAAAYLTPLGIPAPVVQEEAGRVRQRRTRFPARQLQPFPRGRHADPVAVVPGPGG